MAMATVVVSYAYDYPYLTFQTIDGSVQSVDVDQLTLIISDGQLVVQNGKTDATFAISNMSKMYFSTVAAGIADVVADTENGIVEVYSVNGTLVGRFDTMMQTLSSLTNGIYVIKAGNKTQKIIVR